MQCRSCAIASGRVNPRSSAAFGARRVAQSSVIAWISGLCSQKAPITAAVTPPQALDLGGDWWGLDFREEGRVEFCCGGVPFFDCLSRSGLDPCVSIGGEADAIP